MFERLQKYSPVRIAGAWYAKFERPISSLSLVGGFVFNAVFLKRVDLFWENFWIVVHLLIVGVCIILVNRAETEGADSIAESWNPAKLHFWLINIMQFMFGGLLSTFLVFYFRSAVLSVTWPFFLILGFAFYANESLKRHYARLSFQSSFFFLCVFLFMIYIVPVIVHDIGPLYFLISGAASLFIMAVFLLLLRIFTRRKLRQRKSKTTLISTILGIFLLVNALYFLDLIPPLPLALQSGGIFHSISRSNNTSYTVTEEDQGLDIWGRFSADIGKPAIFHQKKGAYIYAFSAVFSPLSFDTEIRHVWQRYDSTTRRWITDSVVPLSVAGGREGGYRTYSILKDLEPGEWRVNITTTSGQLIGRLSVDIIDSEETPVLTTRTVE